MTRKKRNVIVAGVVIIGIVCVLFLLPNVLNFNAGMEGSSDSVADEITFQKRLLEYADFGLYFDDEINVFFYNEQRVRRLVDSSSLFSHDDGIVEITITRNSEGEIIDFDVR